MFLGVSGRFWAFLIVSVVAIRQAEKADDHLTFDAFYFSLFELIDVWDIANTEGHYVAFLHRVFEQVTMLTDTCDPVSSE